MWNEHTIRGRVQVWGMMVLWASLCLCLLTPSRAVRIGRVERQRASPLPVVLWHGMGDSCCDKKSVGGLKKVIEDELGVYVYSIQIGSTATEDVRNGYLGNVPQQVEQVCSAIANTPELQDGFNAIGFSQGGQFLRAVVEKCQHKIPKCSRLITFGGQHQGVMAWPGCKDASSLLCKEVRQLLALGAYNSYLQKHVVQAQYFKDPFQIKTYLEKNIFLPDINNEGPSMNSLYAENIKSLDSFIMYMFEDDGIVVPRESSHFGVYDASVEKVVPLRDQQIYKEDWIGLKALDEEGKLEMKTIPGEHMQIDFSWFNETVVHNLIS